MCGAMRSGRFARASAERERGARRPADHAPGGIARVVAVVSVVLGVCAAGAAAAQAAPEAFVANSDSGTVTVLNASTGAVVTTLRGFSDPWAVAVTPNGKTAYVTNPEQRHGDADHGRDQHAGHADHGRQRTARGGVHAGRHEGVRHELRAATR